jgi:hypothetical protein
LVGGPVFNRRYWPYFRSALTVSLAHAGPIKTDVDL